MVFRIGERSTPDLGARRIIGYARSATFMVAFEGDWPERMVVMDDDRDPRKGEREKNRRS